MSDSLRTPMGHPAPWRLGVLLIAAAVASGLALTIAGLSVQLPVARWSGALLSPRPEVRELLFHYGLVPRIAVSLLAGAALGLSGALFAQVLRNPLAEPSTLGTAAGAGLALAAATLYAPALLHASRFAVALAGGLAATVGTLAIAWSGRFSPVTLVLSGLVVGLNCAALGGILVLTRHEHLTALFLWQSGTLAQNGWSAVLGMAGILAVAACLCRLLVRPLALLELDDGTGRALGLPVTAVRLACLGVAVALAAAVVSAVGVVAFVGLAAPAVARLAGARRAGPRLFASAAAGALLLWLADQVVQAAGRVAGAELPAGLLTALLGAPLLLVLLPRLRAADAPAAPPIETWRQPRRFTAIVPVAAALLVLAMALVLGRSDGGWSLAGLGDPLLAWRWPRTICAFAAGALLAQAGLMIQRVTGNPMASPEVLGISSGAAVGTILFVILAPAVDRAGMLLASGAGALATMLALFLLTRRSAASPGRLLLAGVAITAIAGAFIGIVMLSGHPRLDLLLRMIGGSLYLVSGVEALAMLAIAFGAAVALPLLARPLDLLPLGRPTANALGLAVAPAQAVLVGAVAVFTAVATLVAGPLTFVGLIAPHAARMLGHRRPVAQGLSSALIGGTVMVLADWLGRGLAYPWQLPAGLVAGLIGGPAFLWLLMRGRR